MRGSRTALFNVFTVLLLAATACTVVFYGLVAADVYNPFPAPTRASLLPDGVIDTVTPSGPTDIPTWTPTMADNPTDTLPAGSTRTPTRTPTVTPTFRNTQTPVPPTQRVTRSPYPFTCEVEWERPQYGSPWSGVAGHFEDLDGTPLPGFHAKVECCQGCGQAVQQGGGNPFVVSMYGNQAAWEQPCDETAYVPLEVRVQMFDALPGAGGEYEAVSDQIVVTLGGYAGTSLGYLTCTLNWEDWLPPTPTPTVTPTD